MVVQSYEQGKYIYKRKFWVALIYDEQLRMVKFCQRMSMIESCTSLRMRRFDLLGQEKSKEELSWNNESSNKMLDF